LSAKQTASEHRPPLGLALRLALLCALAACRAPDATPAPSAQPPAGTDPPASCAALDAAWGRDWPATVRVLDRLIAADHLRRGTLAEQPCSALQLCQALESGGQRAEAIAQHRWPSISTRSGARPGTRWRAWTACRPRRPRPACPRRNG
jgi:hypothetical protein